MLLLRSSSNFFIWWIRFDCRQAQSRKLLHFHLNRVSFKFFYAVYSKSLLIFWNVLNNSVTRDSYFLFDSALPIEASDSILAALDLRLSAAACGRQSGANTGPFIAGRSRRCVRLGSLFFCCCCGLLMSDSDAEPQCSRAPTADRAHHCVWTAVALPPAAAHCAAAICRCAYVLKIAVYNVFVQYVCFVHNSTRI